MRTEEPEPAPEPPEAVPLDSEIVRLRAARDQARDQADALSTLIETTDLAAAQRYWYVRRTSDGHLSLESYGLNPRDYPHNEQGDLAFQADWWSRRAAYLEGRVAADHARREELDRYNERQRAWRALVDEVVANTRDDPEALDELHREAFERRKGAKEKAVRERLEQKRTGTL